MDLVDKFLATVTDECGNKIDFSKLDIEVFGFDGVVCLGNVGTDLYIQEDHYGADLSLFNNNQKLMVLSFVDYVQQKMKESREYFENNKIK